MSHADLTWRHVWRCCMYCILPSLPYV